MKSSLWLQALPREYSIFTSYHILREIDLAGDTLFDNKGIDVNVPRHAEFKDSRNL
jgi:hypothetical protein